MDGSSLPWASECILQGFRSRTNSEPYTKCSPRSIFSLYHLVRRPTHILDFSLTLVFVHLILTIYYSSSFPTSIFFWLVVALSSVVQIVLAEQLCVRREMRDGFSANDMTPYVGANPFASPVPDSDFELGSVHPREGKNGAGGGGGEGYLRVPGSETLA